MESAVDIGSTPAPRSGRRFQSNLNPLFEILSHASLPPGYADISPMLLCGEVVGGNTLVPFLGDFPILNLHILALLKAGRPNARDVETAEVIHGEAESPSSIAEVVIVVSVAGKLF